MADFRPYVPADKKMPEFTWSAVLVGAVLGIIFGASSLYLVLKIGITVSASIPVAVLSITLFRWLGHAFGLRNRTILENNIVQTAGSAGESIAFGVGVTMPALMLIGFEMEWSRVMLVSVLGGLLGILMMIPLRRAFIVHLHGKPGEPGKLLYPEGTACAQVLISGDKGGASGKMVFVGFGIAIFHKWLTEGMNLLLSTLTLPLRTHGATGAFARIAAFTGDLASELLGIGYIIGLRTSALMFAGAILGSLVIAPTVAIMGPESWDMEYIHNHFLRGIGAGCLSAAGIISMARTLPMIVRSFASGLSTMRGGRVVDETHKSRTENDLPPSVVFGGSLVLLAALTAFLLQEVSPIAALAGAGLVVLFGFLFVTVSSRLTGEIGSSSNPISGMTIATLLMTCLIFFALGWTTPSDGVLALSIGAVVCIASSNGGTTSQDLKTGFLIGATPRWQQWAILVGAITSAVVIGGTLLLFNQVGTVYSERNLPDINLKDKLDTLKETETFDGKTYHVWRPSDKEEMPSGIPDLKVEVKRGKYLVDDQGRVVRLVDPTITGSIDRRDKFVPIDSEVVLNPDEIKKLETTAVVEKDGVRKVYRLWKNEKEPTDSKYPTRPEVKEDEYLVDEAGHVVYVNEGQKVTLKFPAPKTQVMGVIINGLLKGDLDWTLILIGAFIAVTLELCGVSALAFAVGLYVPMSASTPIFLGGIVRWGVDLWIARRSRSVMSPNATEEEKAEAEVRFIAESESSPAMLMASGFIAGGSLGGVLIAFLSMSDTTKDLFDYGGWIAGVFGATVQSPAIAQQLIALVIFLGLAAVLLLTGFGKPVEPTEPPPRIGIEPETGFRVDE
jgi:putative OPT family oligopeptide transporter